MDRPLIPWPIALAFVIIVPLLLAGCAGDMDKLKSTSTVPVCKALVGPIKYNSQKLKSRRHAGPDLAQDLKQRNQVGEKLHCPAYK